MSLIRRKTPPVFEGISSLGEILRLLGHVDEPALARACEQQKVTGEKIGECLVRMRVISAADVERALDLQQKLRGAKGAEAVREILEAARAGVTSRLDAIAFHVPPTGDSR
jgi:hypothetical protein